MYEETNNEGVLNGGLVVKGVPVGNANAFPLPESVLKKPPPWNSISQGRLRSRPTPAKLGLLAALGGAAIAAAMTLGDAAAITDFGML
jgi:hypothetical protein